MPQSYVQLYVHIVFSTKNRFPFLADKNMREETHAYMGGICKTLDSTPIQINGAADHIHILCMMNRKVALAKTIGEVKRVSSLWIKETWSVLDNFYWQNGYGAFSIGRSEINRVQKYVANQPNHHKSVPFEEEFLKFLAEYEIEYDERYIWD